MFRSLRAVLAVAVCIMLAAADNAGEPSKGSTDTRRSGTIRLDFGCGAEVQNEFRTAVALLHSFFYDEARRRFEQVLEREPDCAMAWWGVAMSWYHPIWNQKLDETMPGLAAARRAKALGGKNELENGLIDAIDAFFRSSEEPEPDAAVAMTCHGPQSYGARKEAFMEGFRKLHERFPDNVEVSTFYALSLLGSTPTTDPKYAERQPIATAILEPLFETNPDHPGIAHYLIHAYDSPAWAARALVAARQYDDIAPWVPHALHMPTHIYTRLGMWKDSIDGNRRSAAAARDYAKTYREGKTIFDELHALDYLMFAYLQTGQDGQAKEVLAHVSALDDIADGNNFAAAFALSAIPARYALERHAWAEAAALQPMQVEFVKPFPFAMGHIEFARAIGAARLGDFERAATAIENLAALKSQMTGARLAYWAGQIESQRLTAEAWVLHAKGKTAVAAELLRTAAKIEEDAGPAAVSPGQIFPAREQLGDLYMATGSAVEALAEYERSLEVFPMRFNSLYGAGRAAELGERGEVAAKHYAALVEMAGDGGGRKDKLDAARNYLAVRAARRTR